MTRLGYDGARRMIDQRFVPSALDAAGTYVDTTPTVALTTAFDESSNNQLEPPEQGLSWRMAIFAGKGSVRIPAIRIAGYDRSGYSRTF